MGVDYNRIAQTYDSLRMEGGPFVPVLVRLAQSCQARRVLELGCGTGNVTAAFLEAHPCHLVGLDLSEGMLDKAKRKGLPARWLLGAASSIPVRNAAFDFVYGSFMLHHIQSLDVALSESARVLDRGCVAFVTSPHEYIRRHPMTRYFPSFAAIDIARFQSEEEIHAGLRAAGFLRVFAERVKSEPRRIDRTYADRVAWKFVSTFELMSEEEFEEGLHRLYRDIEARGVVAEDTWESVVIWGCR